METLSTAAVSFLWEDGRISVTINDLQDAGSRVPTISPLIWLLQKQLTLEKDHILTTAGLNAEQAQVQLPCPNDLINKALGYMVIVCANAFLSIRVLKENQKQCVFV